MMPKKEQRGEYNSQVFGGETMRTHRIKGLAFLFVTTALATLATLATVATAQQNAAPASNVPALPADIPGDAKRWSVLTMGALAGQQATWTTSDGKLHAFFQFNDRGRGPKTTTIMTLGTNGIPSSEITEGNDYLKAEVREEFSVEAGNARWKNKAEQGGKKITSPTFYVSIYGPPEESALLVRAALANEGKLALLPEGESRVRKVGEHEVEAGGKKQRVTLYSVTGLDFSPDYVWLDEAQQYFASGERWFMVIREGWEASQGTLLKVQDEVNAQRARDLAKKLAHRPEKGVIFQHANVFDAQTGRILPDRDVLVTGNKISSVSPAGELNVADLKQIEVMDASGKTLIPGLWDMHAHVGGDDGLLNLAAGVTTVRDLANDTDELLARRKRIQDGTELGTRIILAGIIDGPGPYQGPTKVLAATEAEARAAVDNYLKLGYVQIKIYSSVKPEIVPAIIDEAHKNGLRVSGHIPANMTASQCVKLGFDEIQHVNFLVLNFFPEVKDTQTRARLTEPAKLAARLDLDSAEVQAFARLLKERGTTLDPTMSVFEKQYLGRPGEVPVTYAPVFRRLPTQVRRSMLGGGLQVPEGMDATFKESTAKMVKLVGLMYKAGIPIEAGTDSLAGFTLHRELELDVQAGIPPAEVLKLATLGAARIMKKDAELGSISSGKLADLVLISGNPAENISDVRKTALVVKDGVVYKPAELYAELGIQP
jgi:imidazolonepropionase-like amidohydrolase